MTEQVHATGANDDVLEEDIAAIYGKHDVETGSLVRLPEKRRDFKPWHHPVKQIVRAKQWADLTKRLLETWSGARPKVLRYFTLPGADLLDIRVLARMCESLDVKIEYFGFDAASSSAAGATDDQTQVRHSVTAESVLRQAGRITDEAVIFPDRLEDIALADSHAATQLRLRGTFDVINIDACDHLAYNPTGRDRNTFDALQMLLRHQMRSRTPWLLFITTRAQPSLLGQPGIEFQNAITQNLLVPESGFGAKLAECVNADQSRLAAELNSIWSTHDSRFLRLYAIGLGKFLLQFFHAQPNLPANVELASSYAYRVHNDDHPDMLALAFRITPDEPRVFSPTVGGAAVVPPLEPVRAVRVASQAVKLQDLDMAMTAEEKLLDEAVNGTSELLAAANYDVQAWRQWLEGHSKRPVAIA